MAFFRGMNSITDIWKALIRPPRFEYINEDLGPEVFFNEGNGEIIKRIDIKIMNSRGLHLASSYFV